MQILHTLQNQRNIRNIFIYLKKEFINNEIHILNYYEA